MEASAAVPTPVDAPAAAQTNGQPQAAEPASAQKANRNYGVFTELELDLSSAASKKEATAALEKLAHDGKLTVLARVGRAPGTDPRKALTQLGQAVELDGDYEVIAESARNKYPNVKTKREVVVSIG